MKDISKIKYDVKLGINISVIFINVNSFNYLLKEKRQNE